MNTMHQKTLVFAMILLTIALSGCKKDQKRTSLARKNQTEQIGDVAMPLAQNESMTISLFDEDIENPFAQNSMNLAQNNQELDISWEESTHLKDEIRVVYFPYDSTQPLENEKLAMEDLTKKAQEIYNNDRMVCVKGHSCQYHGTDAYNVALSMKRASTIKENLVAAGIPESHLKVFGVGNEEPVSFDSSLEGQAPNRRVEMYALAA